MSNRFEPGDSVYVVLRDNCAEPVEVTGYIFLACVLGTVLAAPGINGSRDLDSVLCYLRNCTEDDDELPIVAVPVEDCYTNREAAEEAMRDEQY